MEAPHISRSRPVPSFRLHKATVRAVVLSGRSFYLRRYGFHESKVGYKRVIAEYLTAGSVPTPGQGWIARHSWPLG
jgi:hypothetical protein